ncbi:sensor histidine kinase [Agromyces sp. NPDC004153]
MAERGPTTAGADTPDRGGPPRADAAAASVQPLGRFLRARPWLVDAAVSLVFTAIVVATLASEVLTGQATVTVQDALTIAGTAVALLFRRRAPLTVLVVVLLLTTVITFSAQSNLLLAVPIALYAVAAFRSPTIGWIAGAGAYLVTIVSLFAWVPALSAQLGEPGAFDIPVVLLTLAMADTVGVLLGANTWQRAQRVKVLTEQAEQLARERDAQARIATLAERSRIAGEMHDIVAHSLSVMITLADGADAALERDPATARRALDQLAETGRSALQDMRRTLSVLGESTDAAAAREPAPGHADLADLVERFRTAGLPVRFSVRGTPVANAAFELAVYRVVQEALTNTLRYATDAAHVTVAVEYGPPATTVTVTDDGRGAPAGESAGSGRGLIGMAERAAVFGGTVEAGPVPTGGWRVRAVLPHPDGGRVAEGDAIGGNGDA